MPKKVVLPLIVFICFVSGCASGYKQFYQATEGLSPDVVAARRATPPQTTPVIERAQRGDPRTILDAYARRGFQMLGHSIFNSGMPEHEASAINQAREVGADLVLIFNPNYTGSVTSVIPITTPTTTTSYSSGSATAYGVRGAVTAYGSGTTTTYGSTTNHIPITVSRIDYGAIYFVKLRLRLGASFRDLNDAERQELQTNKGVAVELLNDGSPAFNADVLVGDIITAIDGIVVPNVGTFSELLSDRGGRLVTLSIVRRGQRIEKSIQLNP